MLWLNCVFLAVKEKRGDKKTNKKVYSHGLQNGCSNAQRDLHYSCGEGWLQMPTELVETHECQALS